MPLVLLGEVEVGHQLEESLQERLGLGQRGGLEGGDGILRFKKVDGSIALLSTQGGAFVG